MVFTDKFKTFVSRAVAGNVSNNALTKFSGSNQSPSFVNTMKNAL